ASGDGAFDGGDGVDGHGQVEAVAVAAGGPFGHVDAEACVRLFTTPRRRLAAGRTDAGRVSRSVHKAVPRNRLRYALSPLSSSGRCQWRWGGRRRAGRRRTRGRRAPPPPPRVPAVR